MSRQEALFHHLSRLRKGYISGRASMMGLVAFTVFFAVLVGLAILDILVRFSTLSCWFFWLVLLGIGGFGIYHVVRFTRRKISNQAMACLVEKSSGTTENRLINAVQFAENMPGSGRLVHNLLGDSSDVLGEVRSSQLYSQKPLKRCSWGLGVSAVLALIVTLIAPRGMKNATGRMLIPFAGIKPYTRTRILNVKPENVTVFRGRDVEIIAEFGGVLPETAHVVWQRGDKEDVVPLGELTEKQKQEVAEADLPRMRSNVLKGVFDTARYRVVAGDAFSPWYDISVTNPPGLEFWKARISPPAYVKRKAYDLDQKSEDLSIPADSTVVLAGAATAELSKVSVIQDEVLAGEKEAAGRLKFGVSFFIREGGPVRLGLHGENGLSSSFTLPFAILPDQRPLITLVETKQRSLVERTAAVPISFKVTDDYGLTEMGLERIVGEDQYEAVSSAKPEGETKTFTGRFLVDIASFGAREGDTLRFRLWAEDNGRERVRRRGYSPIIQFMIPVAEDRRTAKKKLVEKASDKLKQLVKMQRNNLHDTRRVADLATLEKPVPTERIQVLENAQKNVRDFAGSLLTERAALGELATTLEGLVNHEMRDVLVKFDEAHRVGQKELIVVLAECVRLETRILAALTGLPTGLNQEQKHQEKIELFAALQKIVKMQSNNLKDTKFAQKKNSGTEVCGALAEVEDALGNELVVFSDKCMILIEERVDDDFAKQVRKVYDLLDNAETYEKMIEAAEFLDEANLASAIPCEEQALKQLMEALNILNLWRMRNAKKIVTEATEVLKKTREELTKMEAKQAKIAEVTRDLTSRGKLDDETREKLGKMDEEQKDMAAMLEELANDLYQFPDLPVCDELNSKMREIFEDVEQAMDSENAPAKEIAVQKEDSLLDAIRKTKERVEDVEMWLPDIPDNIVWNMESFDTDEFPEIPLVPLPDELEDLVGDLLDQASDVDAQSQDTTGNNIIADMEMGWGVMDGPMPCFSAKGKSGNTRPNDNEMTGRSGAGREGQSNGELVENHVKGLEGRKTHARRTQDPFQKGMVTEDENSTMDARSTGGGKLGGESESIGMFGKAPRRDLHTKDHGEGPMKLRQETEALYATARLLYLGTGSLGSAARELRGVESAQNRMKSFGGLHRRVLRRLEDSQVEMNSGVVLPMPVATVSKTGGAATDDVDIGKISEEYRDLVSDYYRSLETTE